MSINSGPISSKAINAQRFQEILRDLDDTLTLTDSATSVRELNREIDDTLTLTDSVDSERELNKEIDDTLTLTDSVTITLLLNLEDDLTLTDSSSANKVVSYDIEDTLVLIQELTHYYFEHSINITDQVTITFPEDVTHTLSFTDEFDVEYVSSLITLSNNLTFVEELDTDITYNKTFSDTLDLTDQALVIVSASAEDTLSLTDNVSELLKEQQNTSETLELTDDLESILIEAQDTIDDLNLIQAINLTRDIFELVEQTIGVSHDPIMLFIFQQDISHDLNLLQDWTFINFQQQDVSDVLTLTDVLGGSHIIQQLIDNVGITDDLDSVLLDQQELTENLVLIQSLSFHLIHTKATETLTLTDSVTTVLVPAIDTVDDLNINQSIVLNKIVLLSSCDCMDLLDSCSITYEEELVDTLTLIDSVSLPIIQTIELSDSVINNSLADVCCNSNDYVPDKVLVDDISIEDLLVIGMDDLNELEHDLVLLNSAAYYVV
jgi:hypothetical protein